MSATPGTFQYRDFIIDGALVSYSAATDWEWTHKDYDPTPLYADDGPSDHRHGYAGSVAECIAEIDEWYEDQEG